MRPYADLVQISPAVAADAVAADAGAAKPPASRTLAADQERGIAAAFVLGWRLAELYDRDTLPPPASPAPSIPVPQHLPGSSEMTDHERSKVLLAQAGSALTTLGTVLGIDLPGLAAIRTALDRPDHHRDDVRREIAIAYLEIRCSLLGAAPSAATSYGLGRLLADTTWLPRSGRPDLFLERFDVYRLANAYGWLDDLAADFPRRAAAAVRASLQAWESWVGSQRSKDAAAADSFDEAVLRALRRQGEMWRRLLSGEKDPMQLLGPADYVTAGERLIQRGRQIARRFLWKWSPVIAMFIAASGGAIWAALTYAPAGTARLAAVLVSGTAALGLSWKGVGATLGKALNQAEAALWASEVDVATGQAATILPRRQRKTGRAAGPKSTR